MAATDQVRNELATRAHTPAGVTVPGENDQARMIREVIDRQAGDLALVMPAGLDPSRFARLIIGAVRSTPKLILAFGTDAGQQSVLLAAMEAATVGLEPNTPLQHAWLVPRRRRAPDGSQVWEARLWLGYRGLLTLIRRSHTVRELVADIVHTNDEFGWSRELDRDTLWHRPAPGARGKATCVYAIARMHNGGTQFVVLDRSEVEKRRDCSDGWTDAKSRQHSPWTKWPASMWRKSAVRALVPWLDLSVEVAGQVGSALAVDAVPLGLPAGTGERRAPVELDEAVDDDTPTSDPDAGDEDDELEDGVEVTEDT
jgi:recombination protein RecT